MDKLSIGEVIFKLRKEKGVTQDQLGDFIGVSTAAVSKWESGVCYPDITLLPVLATFFNVTIDKLLNFKIELSKEEVMDIFSECEAVFGKDELETAIEKSKGYVTKHPGSYLLKLRIGFLFNIYSWKGGSEESTMKMLGYAVELFEDVAQNCGDSELVDAALFQLGAIYSTIEEEDKAIDALNKIHKSQYDPNDILTSIYIGKKEYKKAREILQSKLYKGIHDLSLACMGLANSYSKEGENLDRIVKYHQLSIAIKKAFSPEAEPVLSLWMDYFHLTETYLGLDKIENALETLKAMTEDIRKNGIGKAGKFASVWCFNEIPDSKQTITMDLYENIFKMFEQPAFDSIREREEYRDILTCLKRFQEARLD